MIHLRIDPGKSQLPGWYHNPVKFASTERKYFRADAS